MNIDILTCLIVMMGGATVGLSGFVAYRFWWHHRHLKDDGKKLTFALVGQLLGELCIGVVTLAFSVLAWKGMLQFISIETQSVMRFVAFFATSITTIHLARVVEKLHKK